MAFLGTARFLKRTYGEAVLQAIVEDAGVATQLTFTNRINGLALYSYDAFVGLLHAVDRRLGTGDLSMCRTVGDMAARHDLETLFKAYVVRDPQEMIRACAPIWGMYNEDAGQMEAIEASPERTVLRIHDFPQMDPAHCRLMEGWMIAAMDIVGVQILPGAGETECMSDGGRYHEFSCRWSVKENADG